MVKESVIVLAILSIARDSEAQIGIPSLPPVCIGDTTTLTISISKLCTGLIPNGLPALTYVPYQVAKLKKLCFNTNFVKINRNI
jgi:hypothetical protein